MATEALNDAPKNREQQIRRITWIGLIVNVLLGVSKVLTGILGNSQALLADGVHSFADCVTDVAVLAGSRFWSSDSDDNHPYGHRRIETIISIAIGIFLAAIAVGIVVKAVYSLQDSTQEGVAPGIPALCAALISILSKEWLFRWTKSVGKKVRSNVLLANAWHHRSDALSSIPVVIAVSAVLIAPGLNYLDQIAAVLVAMLLLRAAWEIVTPNLMEIVDASAGEEVVEKIETLAAETEDIQAIHAIRTRLAGGAIFLDAHVEVAPELTVREGHNICGKFKADILEQIPSIVDVVIHIEPFESSPSN